MRITFCTIRILIFYKKKMVYPNWLAFAYKYRGREEDAFEDLARTLFRKEMGIKYGLFQRVNHKGNETDVVEKDGKVIGFQSKYFTNRINAKVIIDSMKGPKKTILIKRITTFIATLLSVIPDVEKGKRNQTHYQTLLSLKSPLKRLQNRWD